MRRMVLVGSFMAMTVVQFRFPTDTYRCRKATEAAYIFITWLMTFNYPRTAFTATRNDSRLKAIATPCGKRKKGTNLCLFLLTTTAKRWRRHKKRSSYAAHFSQSTQLVNGCTELNDHGPSVPGVFEEYLTHSCYIAVSGS